MAHLQEPHPEGRSRPCPINSGTPTPRRGRGLPSPSALLAGSRCGHEESCRGWGRSSVSSHAPRAFSSAAALSLARRRAESVRIGRTGARPGSAAAVRAMTTRATAARDVIQREPTRQASSLIVRPSGARVPLVTQRKVVEGRTCSFSRHPANNRPAAARPSPSPDWISARTCGMGSAMPHRLSLTARGRRTVMALRASVFDNHTQAAQFALRLRRGGVIALFDSLVE